MAIQPTPPGPRTPPQKSPGLIAGLIKGNLWVFISPDHKALFISAPGVRGPGEGWLMLAQVLHPTTRYDKYADVFVIWVCVFKKYIYIYHVCTVIHMYKYNRKYIYIYYSNT